MYIKVSLLLSLVRAVRAGELWLDTALVVLVVPQARPVLVAFATFITDKLPCAQHKLLK
jgi:hypothetical protein